MPPKMGYIVEVSAHLHGQVFSGGDGRRCAVMIVGFHGNKSLLIAKSCADLEEKLLPFPRGRSFGIEPSLSKP